MLALTKSTFRLDTAILQIMSSHFVWLRFYYIIVMRLCQTVQKQRNFDNLCSFVYFSLTNHLMKMGNRGAEKF
ncbi:hypothetical protein B7993_15315 [Fibrobacter sp. UWH3]|nr:hypothetical protein B7993_15315 [Fibrobacter sp. UWH3]